MRVLVMMKCVKMLILDSNIGQIIRPEVDSFYGLYFILLSEVSAKVLL